MSYQNDESKVKIYKYYFDGIENPIKIQALNRKDARHLLSISLLPVMGYIQNDLQGETVTVPLFGVTTKTENGVDYTWCGIDFSPSGWMPSVEFSKLKFD